MKISAIAAALALGVLISAPVYAQTPAPKMDAAAREARDVECSKEADAKGLHLKERKRFREECKKRK